MLRFMSLWRHLDGDAGAGGAPAGAPADGAAAPPPTGQPPAPPAPTPPPVDPAEHARLQLQNARLQARITYPRADADALDKLTDLDAIEMVARYSHESAVGRLPATPLGAPVPPSNSAGAAPSAEERRLRELQYAVRRRGRFGAATTITPAEADEAREAFFAASWNAHMEHRRTGRGNVSEPPRGAPAGAAQPPTLPLPGRAF